MVTGIVTGLPGLPAELAPEIVCDWAGVISLMKVKPTIRAKLNSLTRNRCNLFIAPSLPCIKLMALYSDAAKIGAGPASTAKWRQQPAQAKIFLRTAKT